MWELIVDWWLAASRYLPGNDEVIKEVIKYFLVAGVTSAIGWVVWRVLRWVKRRSIANDALARLERARSAIRSDSGVWLTKPVQQPPNYKLLVQRSIPITTVANLKGGVGKTTITGNLAGCLALEGEKILLLDLDFQGSLSSMMLSSEAKKNRPGKNELSKASEALLGGKDPNWLAANARPSPVNSNLFTVPAFYDLARTENRLLVEWLIGDCEPDMPYFLAKLLLSDEVQSKFSRVLIDAPPRLSAACVQALCASTTLLIPTVMDQLSTEAVSTFVNDIEELKRGSLCPHLRYAGVVGSMLPSGTTIYYEAAVKSLTDELNYSNLPIDLLDRNCWIQNMPALGRAAGQTIGALEGDAKDRKAIQEAFSSLVAEFKIRTAPRV